MEYEVRTELSPTSTAADLSSSAALVEYFIRQSRAANTTRNYKSQWKKFATWCEARNTAALPALPEAVAHYAAELGCRQKPSSVQVALSAIAQAHQFAGLPSPTGHKAVSLVMEGIRREKGTKPKQVAAAVKDDIRDMIKALPLNDDTRATRLRALRDRAMILIGFGAALRSAELVALEVEDLAEASQGGLIVTIRRSKTDQTGNSETVGIAAGRTSATDAASSLRGWLDESAIHSGPVFRGIDRHGRILDQLTTRAVALMVKERSEAAGLDNPSRYASHSLRAGLATSAALEGATEIEIVQQTRHKSTAMVKQYVRLKSIWDRNVTEKIGL